ncbi:MAG TPA: class I SAM-dependent methyltransferase [Burkholderiales bacterium]|nr:class I SAM-dependent methyltransferase [Burkholderiales bacterium]
MLEARLLNLFENRLRQLDLPVTVSLWNGRTLGSAADPKVAIRLRNRQALSSFVKPSMGKLAKRYVEQDIDVDGDPRDVLDLGETLCDAGSSVRSLGRHLPKWFRHTRLFDRKAIHYHYDVNDDFFGLWLDHNRVYSCAYFRRADDTLDQAQEQKLDHICRKLRLQPGERFLDIGCGWGALIRWAARNYGVRATGITLSDNQHRYAREKIAEEGLTKNCEVMLMDYRDLPETEPFDKIASVGMVEHVGRTNLPIYFAKIFRLLRPGGTLMNHGIALNLLDQGELGSDMGNFIDEYVFPGGQLAHISQMVAEMSRQGLECWDVESLRPHYARTLWHWVDRLEANREQAVKMVGEKIYRIWRIYMAGSAHAFERGWLSLYQVLAGKPLENGTLDFPIDRSYIYSK